MKREEIEEYLFNAHNHHPDDGEVIYYAKDVLPLIERITPKWISVEERKPDEKLDVLIRNINATKDTPKLIGFNMYGSFYSILFTNQELTVTHWMELPEDDEL